jgi:hypothetical protein
MELHDHASEATKHLVDAVSIATVFGTLAQILPPLAALFTIVWTCIRIYETKTVQKWLGKDVSKRTGDE